jgi:alpha-N-arabinofuranosidase
MPINLLAFTPQSEGDRATLTVDCAQRSTYRVNPYLFGKFCEHLGHNIYNGMEAEILFNPTFGKWVFGAAGGDNRVNGGLNAEYDVAKIAGNVRVRAQHFGWPEPSPLLEDYLDACAYGWFRIGTREVVRTSADVNAHGARAQRVEVLRAGAAPCGLGQWTYLPLHRTRRYEYRVVARAAQPVTVELALAVAGVKADEPMPREGQALGPVVARTTLALGRQWQTLTGTLEIPADAALDPAALYRLALTATAPANIVLDRVLLYPADHIHHADPDIIRLLREAKLPLLRWPGGNFVSGYHWREGVGPVDARQTLPNPAWESLEYNLFGTDEFLQFCRAVGCEPMICLNAGNGTPQEAAEWVEYCNGAATTPLGQLRAANGHPEPYGVKLWEIGNELDGRHQVSWTTPGGYADRYACFYEAMKAVDASIRIYACGYHRPLLVGQAWNSELIATAREKIECLTHHSLNGGLVNEETNRVELFHAFMGYAGALGKKYETLAEEMRAHGIATPRVAITELQLFSHFAGTVGIGTALSPATMPTPATMAEPLYLATILHESIRRQGLVEMITHSATVNHGGGLRKVRERVFANPVHYAHALEGVLAGGTPVAVTLHGPAFSTHMSFDNGAMPALTDVPALDPVAVLSADGKTLTLMVVHRSATTGPLTVTLALKGFAPQGQAKVTTLSSANWWDQNTLDAPTKIVPQEATLAVRDGQATITLPPYSLTRLVFRA